MKSSLIALLLALASVNVQAAGDAAAGQQKAAVCVACHGADGIAVIAEYPNLAGQKVKYLQLAIKAYRDGERRHAVMSPMAAGLSEQDIADIAAFYASLPPAGTSSSK